MLFRAASAKDDFASRVLDRRDRSLGGSGNLDPDSRAQLALGQEANAIGKPPEHAACHEGRPIERALGLQLTLIERDLQAAQIDHHEILAKHAVAEAALWQTAVQRRLAALKAVERDAGARGLTFAAARRSLALARADAAPHPLCPIVRSGIVSDVVELHRVRLTPSLVSGLPTAAKLSLVHDTHEVLHLIDHAPNCPRVLQHPPTVELIQPESLQCRPLIGLSADRATDLHD